jgi:regulator of RNase E activity RraA
VGYSVWALGPFMRSGKNRVRMAAAQVPVVLGTGEDAVTVRPGDLVCADGSGVVTVPVELVGAVTDRVEKPPPLSVESVAQTAKITVVSAR